MIIYPSGEYKLEKGDVVVCITEHFQEFTYGKQYTLYASEVLGSNLLPITSDLGNQPFPCFCSPTGYYFLPLNIWRKLRINKVLENK